MRRTHVRSCWSRLNVVDCNSAWGEIDRSATGKACERSLGHAVDTCARERSADGRIAANDHDSTTVSHLFCGCLNSNECGAYVNRQYAVEIFETEGVDRSYVRMPALVTKISSWPSSFTVFVTAARSSSAEALSALIAKTLPPADSISRASWSALSCELEYVNPTEAPSVARCRTMAAPIPLEPPVTRATLYLNRLSCIGSILPNTYSLIVPMTGI